MNAYREAMAEFAQMGNMDIWYARLTEPEIMDAIATLTKQEKTKLAEVVDGRYRIVSQPPVVIPARELEAMYGYSGDEIQEAIHQ